VAAATAVKNGAARNDMLDRLGADPDFGVAIEDLQNVVDARRYVGRAPQQVDEFLTDVIAPILASGAPTAAVAEEIRV
jgi:adenylosuccinate lyase